MRRGNCVAEQLTTCSLHEETLKPPASLKQGLHCRTDDLGTEIYSQTLELDAVRGERVDVRIVHEINPVKINHPQIRGR